MEPSQGWWARRPQIPAAGLVALAVALGLVAATLGVTAMIRLPARGTSCNASTAAAEVFPALVAIGGPGAQPTATGTVIRGNGVILTSLAALPAGGKGPASVTLSVGGKHDGRKITQADGTKLTWVTAIAFAGPDTLVVANGSDRAKSADWKRDLMAKGASGSVWRIGLASGTATRIGQGLAFPAGLAISGSDILVAEAWRHRVVAFAGPDAPPRALLEDLPAYPGRILPASGGGFWLSLFAPRNALVEFVLTEDTYRNEMMATIDPAYWIAPALRSGRSFLEPIQGGARKKLNMLKPWSPSWSYGLVARCDSRMHPLGSSHSRADGRVHGVTAIAERDGTLFVAARGSGVIVALKASRLAGGAA